MFRQPARLEAVAATALRVVLASAAAAAGLAACDQPGSATDLHPEGPPMVRQVLLREVVTHTTGQTSSRVALVFGDHPDADRAAVHSTGAALARPGQRIRVVVDELLRGNPLEEIACNGLVDDDAFARVPMGATPDDVARCARPAAALPRSCPADDPHSLCIGPDGPVGVLDRDGDGAADGYRFRDGAAVARCGELVAPMDLAKSYWQPSGNQLVPASPAGLDGLGPALVLWPRLGLPNGVDCSLDFADDVVDKSDLALCAPADGDPAAGCAPGDTAAIRFGTEALRFTQAFPADGAIDVPTVTDERSARPVRIALHFDALMDPDDLRAQVVIDAGGVRVEPLGFDQRLDDDVSYLPVLPGPGAMAAGTTYRITIPPTVRNVFGQPLGGAPIAITFATRAP